MAAMREGNEEAAISATRSYYERIDSEMIRVLDTLLSLRRRAALRDHDTDHDTDAEAPPSDSVAQAPDRTP